jgi:hypothetical protein
MRVQLNIYVGEQLFAIPDFGGFVPRKGERVLMQGTLYEVEEVGYEFAGSPLDQAHINVYLTVCPE